MYTGFILKHQKIPKTGVVLSFKSERRIVMETDEKNQDLAEGENAIKTKKKLGQVTLYFVLLGAVFGYIYM